LRRQQRFGIQAALSPLQVRNSWQWPYESGQKWLLKGLEKCRKDSIVPEDTGPDAATQHAHQPREQPETAAPIGEAVGVLNSALQLQWLAGGGNSVVAHRFSNKSHC
jgi:hypothetical protein